MNFDSGSGVSQLNYDYFKRHKDRIEQIAEKDSMRNGRFRRNDTSLCVYKMPGGGCFQIGEYTGCIDSLSVVQHPEKMLSTLLETE